MRSPFAVQAQGVSPLPLSNSSAVPVPSARRQQIPVSLTLKPCEPVSVFRETVRAGQRLRRKRSLALVEKVAHDDAGRVGDPPIRHSGPKIAALDQAD